MTFAVLATNDLPEFSMIAGSDQELIFNIYDSGSSMVNLNSATITWSLAYYGQSDAIVTKSGIYSGSPINQFIVNLIPSDTAGIDGKHIQQYTIVDFSGKTYKPSQGVIYIIPNIS
jgi:hypothetical protein